jgi:peptidoglycan lytic transglycosylase G
LGSPLRISLIVVVMCAVAFAGGVMYLRAWAATPLPVAAATIVELHPGESFSGFARQLDAADLVEPAWLFSALARLEGRAQTIQAGEYRIEPGMTAMQLLSDLVAGRVVRYPFRIVEGSTIRNVLQQLAAAPKLDFDLQDVGVEALMPRLGIDAPFAEGQFFPDTYDYSKGTPASELLERAHARLHAVLGSEWDGRAADLPYQSPSDALIVASLIEKETGRDADRANIARVFVTRLQRSMRLQTDPSVIYGLGDAFDGNLKRAHLIADNPYNTYKYRGLPPTPIALPGRASLHAALHPADHDYLYFVARGDGSSEFSSTLAEHTAAVRRYQLQAARDGR